MSLVPVGVGKSIKNVVVNNMSAYEFLKRKKDILFLYKEVTEKQIIAMQNANLQEVRSCQEEKDRFIIELKEIDNILKKEKIDQSGLKDILRELEKKETVFQQYVAAEQEKLKEDSSNLVRNKGKIKQYLMT